MLAGSRGGGRPKGTSRYCDIETVRGDNLPQMVCSSERFRDSPAALRTATDLGVGGREVPGGQYPRRSSHFTRGWQTSSPLIASFDINDDVVGEETLVARQLG